MTAIIPIQRNKVEELKHLMKEGMHLIEEMCEESQIGERYGSRDMDYPYGDRMRQIGASTDILSRAHTNLVSGQLNNGLTYSNPKTRETVWVTCITSSAREFFNTIVHEIGHVAQHIGLEVGISPYDEDICYLQGELAFRLFPYCKELLCEHCRCTKHIKK